ncbi:MAG: hypothetical protein SPE78_01370 [Actinobacillus minor]|nr:hypothetical protein [Actinobacillus minor]
MLIGFITSSLSGFRAALLDEETKKVVWRHARYYTKHSLAVKALEAKVEVEKRFGKRIKIAKGFNKPKGVVAKIYSPSRDWDNTCYTLTPEEYYQRLAQEA